MQLFLILEGYFWCCVFGVYMNTLLTYLQRLCQGYSDYVAIHNWSAVPSPNTLVLNDEKASVFSEAKFEPLPVPPKIEFTYAKFKAPR